MVGLVVVSHSATLARGVVELATQMGGDDVPVEAAGGMAEPEGAIGTDAMLVLAAIERAARGDGVLVLVDLGSAVMSAEMALEMADGAGEVRLEPDAPLVEGAVAAAALARTGAGLEEVAAAAAGTAGAAPAPAGSGEDAEELTVPVTNRDGLHLRPAQRVVELLGPGGATVTVANATTGAGPADGRSLLGLVGLGARRGHELVLRASGAGAEQALRAVAALAAAGFGDEEGAAPAVAADAPASGDDGAAAGPPGSGERLPGVAAAPGIALAPARRLVPVAPGDAAATGSAADELTALEAARDAARADLEAARGAVGGAEGAIFSAHLALLDDAALLGPARAAIETGRSAAAAWSEAARTAAAGLRGLDDTVLRERAVDVEDVGARVVAHLQGDGIPAALSAPGILVADELTPSQAAGLDRRTVLGVATARGSATAHAAILARALGLPVVVGLGARVLEVEEGTELGLDADEAVLVVAPEPAVRARLEARRDAVERHRAAARARASEPATTRDGHRIAVLANLGSAAEVPAALAAGAEGVGLLRTEFLFLDRAELPGEDEQVEALRAIAEGLAGRPLTVRTLDVGADKPLAALPQPPETNPFLGRRGLRLSLAEPELLRTQLRAVLRVAAEHPLRLMFPMVSTADELRAARAELVRARREVGLDPPLPVGIMVEVPGAALLADRLAAEAEFLSLGTNDLAQYTMAAERGDPRLAHLISGPGPAVLRLVAGVAAAGHAHGRGVSVCGELAGDPAAAVLLAGLGVGALSAAPAALPEVKAALRAVTLTEAREAAARALEAEDAPAARAVAAALLAREG